MENKKEEIWDCFVVYRINKMWSICIWKPIKFCLNFHALSWINNKRKNKFNDCAWEVEQFKHKRLWVIIWIKSITLQLIYV